METAIARARIERYIGYKPSGINWLGDLPSDWKAISNKYIFKLRKHLVGKKFDQYTLLSLTLNGVIKRDMDNPQGKFPAEFDTYQEVRSGDFIFCLFDVEETPRTVGLSEFDGMITGAYTVFDVNAKEFEPRYLYYFYLNLDSGKRLKPLYTGLRNTISKESFFSFKTFVPPLPEQTRIARFLDHKTALIDKAIAQKEKLIELLKERRQILIHNAVTKGLNPNVKMKDSGLEWIGEMPEHWEIKKLRYVGRCQNGINKGAEHFGTGYPFINYTDVYNNIELPNVITGLVESSEAERRYYSVKSGDVLFTRTSETIEEIGFASTCTRTIGNVTFAGFLIRFRPKAGILNTGFSKYYFCSSTHRTFFIKEMNLVTRASLSQELLKRLSVLIPPRSEQEQIGCFLDNRCDVLAKAINMARIEILNLREYKATLINSAVTGKIKVPDLETMD